ncbi:MAG: hypothetical protein OXE50_16030 [Chloroflexi bacterium]|nr:hypothetical protein [Chloroflexota bacterium]
MNERERTITLTESEYNDLERILDNEHRIQGEDIENETQDKWSPMMCVWFSEENPPTINEETNPLTGSIA